MPPKSSQPPKSTPAGRELLPRVSSISEKSLTLKIYVWSRACRELYGRSGIYSVYCVKTERCLYVGKSTDLGKRILRFFSPRAARPAPIVFKGSIGAASRHEQTTNLLSYTSKDIYVEVTTFENEWKLDAFERSMIGIKKPMFNILLNYSGRGRGTHA